MGDYLRRKSDVDMSTRIQVASTMCQSIANLGPDRTFYPHRALSRGVVDILENTPSATGSDIESALHTLQRATVERFKSGDSEAASDYLRGMTAPHQSVDVHGLEWLFRPVILYPDNAELMEFGEKAFAKGGPWDLRGRNFRIFTDTMGSRLLLIPSFHEYVLEGLQDDAQVALAWVEKGTLEIRGPGDSRSTIHLTPQSQIYRESVPTFTVRRSDSFARSLSDRKMKGAPAFDLFWPEDQRDAAVREWVTYLKKNRDRLPQLLDESEPYPQNLKEWRKIEAR